MLDHPYLRLTYIKTTESRCSWSATSARLCQFFRSWKDLKRTEREWVKKWIFYGSIKVASRLLLQEHSSASSSDSPPILSFFRSSEPQWFQMARIRQKCIHLMWFHTIFSNIVWQTHIISVSGDLHLHHIQTLSNCCKHKYNQSNFTNLVS